MTLGLAFYTKVVMCVSYLQLKVTNQQHNLDCTLTTTIWNQHSKKQTSGKISKRVAAPRDSKVLPRWRFLTPLDGNEYYYQVLLLNVPFRSEGELISDPNASGTWSGSSLINESGNTCDSTLILVS